MKKFKFSHFVSNIALNGISIAAYCNTDKTIYKLVAEENGAKIRGTHIVELMNTKTCHTTRTIQRGNFYMSLRCVELTFVKQKRLGYQPFFILNK